MGCTVEGRHAFEFETRVRYSEVTPEGALSLPALIGYFQDVTHLEAQSLGIGKTPSERSACGWVLANWHIAADAYPAIGESVTIGTFVSRLRGPLCTRCFYLRDATGQMAIKARSDRAYVDVATGALTRPPSELAALYTTSAPLEMPEVPRRIPLPRTLRETEPVRACATQIDMNRHVNNVHYVRMALDVLDSWDTPHHARVDYRQSAHLGNTIYPACAIEAERALVALNAESGEPYAIIELSR